MQILLGERGIKIINLLVTDGDFQDFGKGDIAINKQMPINMHMRFNYKLLINLCGYYVSNQSDFGKGCESYYK